jgi:hypothetical protein
VLARRAEREQLTKESQECKRAYRCLQARAETNEAGVTCTIVEDCRPAPPSRDSAGALAVSSDSDAPAAAACGVAQAVNIRALCCLRRLDAASSCPSRALSQRLSAPRPALYSQHELGARRRDTLSTLDIGPVRLHAGFGADLTAGPETRPPPLVTPPRPRVCFASRRSGGGFFRCAALWKWRRRRPAAAIRAHQC